MTDLSSVTIHVTCHALERFRYRFVPNGTEEQLRSLAQQAIPAPAWLRKTQIQEAGKKGIFFVVGEMVLVVHRRGTQSVAIITIINLSACRNAAKPLVRNKGLLKKRKREAVQ